MHRIKLILFVALAAGAAATETAAAQQGGLSVSPSILETTAKAGATTSTVVTNTTNRKLRVTVSPRPWKQARDGAVAANRRRKLGGVALSTKRFTLAANARRTVYVTMGRVPSQGSVFGALDVVGKPAKRRKGINVAYRIVSSLRFNPAASKRRHALRAGNAGVSARTLKLLVRNAGNTVDAVTGSVSISGGGGGRSGAIGAVRILPGKLVSLPVTSLRGLRRGSYSARIVLKQAGRNRLTVTKSFRIR